MAAALYEVILPAPILRRGFWLYAWRIVGPRGERLCYIGMTGDVNGSAQSPYVRAGAHLGFNPNSNALRRRLVEKDIQPECCRTLEFAAHGPVQEFIPDHAEHEEKRRFVGKLERRLWIEAQAAGHCMLNGMPQFTDDYDPETWAETRASFAAYLGFKASE